MLPTRSRYINKSPHEYHRAELIIHILDRLSMQNDIRILSSDLLKLTSNFCNCCIAEILTMATRSSHGEHAPALTVSDQALRTAQEYFSEMLRSTSPLAYTQHPLQAYNKLIRAETCYQ